MLKPRFTNLRKAFTHAIYYLAAFPEYMKPLREEVEEIIQREGWTKPGIDQMYKIDSFIRESQRLHPLGIRKSHTVLWVNAQNDLASLLSQPANCG